MKKYLTTLAMFAAAGILVGCSQEPATTSSLPRTKAPAAQAVDGAKFMLAAEPAGASNVIKVREDAVDGAEIVIVGRIGGSASPWVAGRAAFSIVDESLRACSDIEGDGCPQPWDYCCETEKLPTAMALVKFVDQQGQLVKADARELLSVKELSTVVVKGTAQRDEAGNLTVLATSMFVKKK